MATSRSRGHGSGASSGGGCGVVIFALILLGLAIEYWYVTLLITVVVIAVICVSVARGRRAARHRSGPADPWCDEVTVALRDLGFEEWARNQFSSLRGVPVHGNVELRSRFLTLDAVLFADAQTAHRAEMALRADPQLRDALRHGGRAVIARGSVLYQASARKSVVDEALLDEAVRTVDLLPVRLATAVPQPGALRPLSVSTPIPANGGALVQLGELAALHAQGALSDEEFTDKKVELLKRI